MKQLLLSLILASIFITACNDRPSGVYSLQLPMEYADSSDLLSADDSLQFNMSVKQVSLMGDTLETMTMAGTLRRENFEVVDGFVRLKGDSGQTAFKIQDNQTLVADGANGQLYSREGGQPEGGSLWSYIIIAAIVLAAGSVIYIAINHRRSQARFARRKAEETMPEASQAREAALLAPQQKEQSTKEADDDVTTV